VTDVQRIQHPMKGIALNSMKKFLVNIPAIQKNQNLKNYALQK
jgi:hypothetical protein